MNLAIVTALLFALSTPALAQPITLKVGQRQQVAPTGRSAGAPANWMSSDPRIASVINSASPKFNGMVVGHKPGQTIVVTSDTSITVTVFK